MVVVCGIAAIVLAVHLTGGTTVAHFATDADARDRFLIDFPEAGVEAVHMSANRRDAVLELADGHLGVVHAMGSNYLTRYVHAREMLAGADGAKLKVVTRDLTWPRAEVTFEDTETAARVAALFGGTEDRKAS
jgi:hypothetical protein